MRDLALCLNISDVVAPEDLPLVRRVARVVSRPASIGLRRLARLAEVGDERLAFLHLGLIVAQFKRFAHHVERARQAAVLRGYHGVPPLLGRHRRTQPVCQTGTLKIGVVGLLDYPRIAQVAKHLCGDFFAAGDVDQLHRLVVVCVRQQ